MESEARERKREGCDGCSFFPLSNGGPRLSKKNVATEGGLAVFSRFVSPFAEPSKARERED